MTEPLSSTACHYTYAAIHGATLSVFRDRLIFLKCEWENGVRFSSIVLLTGDRPLIQEMENENTLLHSSPYPFRKGWTFEGPLPTNESEMMSLVFDQLDLPSQWRQMPLKVVEAKKTTSTRATTADTLVTWMNNEPCMGSVLFVSSQPFVGRQDSVARHILPRTFSMETIGSGFSLQHYQSEPRALGILLDELARWIYEEKNN